MCFLTSVVYSLFPKDSLQVLGPGTLYLPVDCLKCVCVLGFPLPEPDFETQASVTAVLGQAYVWGLNTHKDKQIMQDGSFECK